MSKSTTLTTNHFSPAASLAAIGVKMKQLDLFGPIRTIVQIPQKTVKHTPADKLHDALISLLAGAHGLVEINTRLRADPALQHAFGRQACAEQSVVQETLDRCTEGNVAQMQQALDQIYQQHSQGFRHNYRAGFLVLDVDMSGMPCGPKAAFATRGYFAKQRNRRGRQLGRVLASQYEEVVTDRLFAGNVQLTTALQPMPRSGRGNLAVDESETDTDACARGCRWRDVGRPQLASVSWVRDHGQRVFGPARPAPGQDGHHMGSRSGLVRALVWLGERTCS